MPTRHWFDPVNIWDGDIGRRGISSVEEAAEWLLTRWPAEHHGDEEHAAARLACLTALDGTGATEAAREAFLAAAARAALLMTSKDER